MQPLSILTVGVFFFGYITARWDLVTRLYELAIFAWDHGVFVCVHGFLRNRSPLRLCQTRAAKGFAILSVFFFLLIIPVARIANHEIQLVHKRMLYWL